MFVLAWKGFGFLVPISYISAGVIEIFFLGGSENPSADILFYGFASLICFAISILVSRYRQATCEQTVLRDETTGKEKDVLLKNVINTKTDEEYQVIIEDTFFGIPIKYWSIIFLALGVLVYFLQLAQLI